MLLLDTEETKTAELCFFCKNKKTKYICPFELDKNGNNVNICNACFKEEYISLSDVKKNYIGLDYSSDSIRYIKVWINSYKIEAKYLFKKDLDKLYKQFKIEYL